MSNLYKSGSVVCAGTEKKVIDYNSMIYQKIQKIQKEISRGHHDTGEGEFVEGINPAFVTEMMGEEAQEPEHVLTSQQQAEQILAIAKSDAQAVIDRANQEAEEIRDNHARIGRQEGYEEGRRQADEELARMRKEIEQERVQMEIEYHDLVQQIEPMLVDTILTVFEKVTHVLVEDQRDIVYQLVNDVLAKTETGKELLIRVSEQDYKFMIESRDKIAGAVSQRVHIEIVEDRTFHKGQCMIESESGIYDCSLDIQLENLIRSIKVLSCMAAES